VDRLPIPGGCTVEQVVNDIPGEGIKNLPPYLPPEQGNLIRFKSIKGVLEEQNGEEESDPKTAKTPVNTGVLNGRGERIRTFDFLLPKQDTSAQKSLKTLSETDPPEILTTLFTTQNENLPPRGDLLEALKSLPREALLGLISELLKP